MGANSKIEWTHDSINFWWGCVEVSPGCDNCYARELAKRWGGQSWGVNAPRRIIKGAWADALTLQRLAERKGERRRVFCQSMSDIAEILPENHPQRAEIDDLRSRVFTELIPATPNLDWLLLTKRIGNVAKVVPSAWLEQGFPANVWAGISVVNQAEADRDIPKLLRLPCSVRFLSCEPLLGEIRLPKESSTCLACGAISLDADVCPTCDDSRLRYRSIGEYMELDWVIVGGESGQKARPMHPDWARSLRDQCTAAGVPFFFKQWGEYCPAPQGFVLDATFPAGVLSYDGMWRGRLAGSLTNDLCEREGDAWLCRPGKKTAGRLLDGREWSEFPETKGGR